MNLRLLTVTMLLFHIACALAADITPSNAPRPLRGNYQLYGGTLSEMLPPTSSDKKVAFMLTGPAAKTCSCRSGRTSPRKMPAARQGTTASAAAGIYRACA